MKLLTPSQARELDRVSMDEMGIPRKVLTGNAGQCIAEKAMEMLSDIPNPFILILCGKGNNGGDGFAAASILYNNKFNIQIHSTSIKTGLKDDRLIYYFKYDALGIEIGYGTNLPKFNRPDLLIDGLFGTGFRGELRPEFIPWFDWINESTFKVLSIDIPSGLNGDSGKINPKAVKADTTLTFGAAKVGMIFRDGKEYSGKVTTGDIGYPEIELSGLQWELIEESFISSLLKRPKTESHKYSVGKVLIIAGSIGMTGAAILATFGALRSGAGLTITTAPSSLNEIFERSIIEGMTLSFNDDGKGYLSTQHFDKIMEKVEWADSIVIGPGLGRNEETQFLIKKLVLSVKIPMVLDADGLFPFNNNFHELNEREFPLVITPHIGELSKLIKIDKEDIVQKFPEVMTEFMSKFDHTLLAKQVPSCILHGKKVMVNSTGNPGLATGGTGDVLSGMVGSFIAQGFPIETAASIASFVHGKSSDNLVEERGFRGQIASDLLLKIPEVISFYEKS